MRPFERLPVFGVFLVFVFFICLACGGSPARVAAAPTQAPDTMVATVQDVDVQDSTVTAVYGVSLALKAVEMTVAPQCSISMRGSQATLSDLRRGQVVHIRYRVTDGRLVAQAIEVVRTPGGGR